MAEINETVVQEIEIPRKLDAYIAEIARFMKVGDAELILRILTHWAQHGPVPEWLQFNRFEETVTVDGVKCSRAIFAFLSKESNEKKAFRLFKAGETATIETLPEPIPGAQP